MLKAHKLALGLAAALGMSSALAQSPGSSPAGWSYYNMPDGRTLVYAGGSPVGGFRADASANTYRFNYQPQPTSPVPVTSGNGTYTTLKRMGGGFTLEQRSDLPVPGRPELRHPVALRKPVPTPTMAKAFARTLPILGNALALKELFDTVYGDTTTYFDASQNRWERPPSNCSGSTCYEWGYSSFTRQPSALSFCQFHNPAYVRVRGDGQSSIRMEHFMTVVSSTQQDCNLRHVYADGTSLTTYRYPVYRYSYTFFSGTGNELTQTELENKLSTLPTWPPQADPLLPSIPQAAMRDLSNETAASPTPVQVVPQSPTGTDLLSPWESDPTVSVRDNNMGTSPGASSTTTTSVTVGTPQPDGSIRYDTRTTTTTTTVTGTDPVTGQPITETTTTNETTQQTPNKPMEGEDLECGLPGTPSCKIDETGTPDSESANLDQAEQEIETFKTGLLAAVMSKLDEIVHEWTWTFQLPTGCSALQFDTKVGPVVSIDMCEHQPVIHELMSMLWAAAGVFGALAIFLRANG